MLSRLATQRTLLSARMCGLQTRKMAVLSLGNLPKTVVEAEYAVRGAIVSKSMEMEEQLKSGNHNLPFKELVPCNIGNPQAVGDTPVTYHRQVVSLLSDPELVNSPKTADLYPKDVMERAKTFLRMNAKMGAYSHSKGVRGFRDVISEFIEKRDGQKCDPESIFITNGASDGVKTALE